MATKTANDAAKKKAAKEKKILVFLIVFLVVALGYAYKTLTKLRSASPPTPVAATTTTSATGTSTPAPASTPSSTPSTGTGTPSTSSGTTAPSTGSDGLVSAATPPLGQGQLRTFTLFDSKDPFFANGPTAAEANDQSSTPSGSSSSSGGQTSSKPAKPPAATETAPTSAVISVNGVKGVVDVGSDFPVTTGSSNGIFQLVSLTKTTARVAIAGGSYASGAATLTLHVDQPVTLANTADGIRYTLKLFPQGTSVPSPPAGSGGTQTSTTTTTT